MNKMTKKKYTPKIQNILMKKMRDDFDRAKECVNFIDKLRDKKNGQSITNTIFRVNGDKAETIRRNRNRLKQANRNRSLTGRCRARVNQSEAGA